MDFRGLNTPQELKEGSYDGHRALEDGHHIELLALLEVGEGPGGRQAQRVLEFHLSRVSNPHIAPRIT